jgi:hypothetical protein
VSALPAILASQLIDIGLQRVQLPISRIRSSSYDMWTPHVIYTSLESADKNWLSGHRALVSNYPWVEVIAKTCRCINT